MPTTPSRFEIEYSKRPAGARLKRAEHLVAQMTESGLPQQDGADLLNMCARASRHCSGHAIELHRRTGGIAVNSDVAVSRGGVSSDIARRRMPFVADELDPSVVQAHKLS